MKLITTKKVGKNEYTFEFEGENLHECIIESQKLSFPDLYKCGVCSDDNLRLNAYVTKEGGFKYTQVLCNKCRASLTFGQTKADPDVFYLRNADGKFEWKEFKTETPIEKPSDDLPF